VDRDTLPDESVARRGVPPGRHAHGRLALVNVTFELAPAAPTKLRIRVGNALQTPWARPVP
jgi:hypothetical protein